MIGCWFRKGCVSDAIWLGLVALRRSGAAGALAVETAELASVLD